MATFMLSFLIIAAAAAALAVGVLAGRRPIAGSCGGLACGSGEGCAACSAPDKTGVSR